MKTLPPFSVVWRPAKRACAALIAIAWLPPFAFSAPLQPGAQLDVVSKTPSGEVRLTFRYCPPGEGFRGKPEPLPEDSGDPIAKLNRRKLVESLRAFYVTETEVSQGQYRQILGQAALDQVKNRVAKLAGVPVGDEFPVLAVTLDEAAAFCCRLQQTAVDDSATKLEARGFRLPTHYEWQYACRARQTLDEAIASPHFGGWCSLQEIPAAQMQDGKDLWKKAGGAGEFTGTQDQIERILRTVAGSKDTDDQTRAIKLLEAFLQKGVGFDRPLTNRGTVRTVDSGKSNPWNIRNMHGSLYEWTIVERDLGKRKQIFQFLAGSQSATMPDSKSFLLAGAGYNFSFQRQNVAEWVKFSVWGGEPFDIEKGIPDPWDYPTAKDEKQAIEFCPGLRIVLDRVLSPTWLLVIRKSVVAPKVLDDKVHAELDRSRNIITELGGTKAEMAAVKYYEFLANYRMGRMADAARDVKDAASSLSDNDPYFRLLGQLVERDAVK